MSDYFTVHVSALNEHLKKVHDLERQLKESEARRDELRLQLVQERALVAKMTERSKENDLAIVKLQEELEYLRERERQHLELGKGYDNLIKEMRDRDERNQVLHDVNQRLVGEAKEKDKKIEELKVYVANLSARARVAELDLMDKIEELNEKAKEKDNEILQLKHETKEWARLYHPLKRQADDLQYEYDQLRAQLQHEREAREACDRNVANMWNLSAKSELKQKQDLEKRYNALQCLSDTYAKILENTVAERDRLSEENQELRIRLDQSKNKIRIHKLNNDALCDNLRKLRAQSLTHVVNVPADATDVIVNMYAPSNNSNDLPHVTFNVHGLPEGAVPRVDHSIAWSTY